MRIALLCASLRGLAFLSRLVELAPDADLLVVSFREEPWEPPFLDLIRDRTLAAGGRFEEARRVDTQRMRAVWNESPVDLLLAVGWRYLVPAEVYGRPRLGAFVLHDSLLPHNRGFSPTVWSMIRGESETGVSLIAMAEEADAGDIVDQLAVPIGPDDSIAAVREAVTRAYLEVLERALPDLVAGRAELRPQDHAHATWCEKRLPSDNRIDWGRSVREIHNLIRATSRPYPGAFTEIEGRRLTVWAARPCPLPAAAHRATPGQVMGGGARGSVLVACGAGSLEMLEVQVEAGAVTEPRHVLCTGARLGP